MRFLESSPKGLLALLETVAGNATQFVDSSVELGSVYEYQIIKTAAEYTGYGLIRAGIEAPLVENRGKIVLVVADTHAADLAPELNRLQQDLIGDGWTCCGMTSRPATAPKPSRLTSCPITPRTLSMCGLSSCLEACRPLLGRSRRWPHNHLGAWPADVYYADMHGLWTVSSSPHQRRTHTALERPRGRPIRPGLPAWRGALQLGRVDLSI